MSGHAKNQIPYRGATEGEVCETIRTAPWQPAELERLECRKDFVFEKEWNKKYYKVKQVRPIFVEEDKEIVVVTLFSFKRRGRMRISYDSEVDALYIRFIETTVTTKHVAEGIAVDYDSEGRIAGIEILGAVKRLGSKDVFKKVTLEDLAMHVP